MKPTHDPPAATARRLSKLAAVALLLSPVPLVATAVLVVVAVPTLRQHRAGPDVLGALLFVGVAGQTVLISGTVLAAVTATIGATALWRIARRRVRPLRGRRLAWAAIVLSAAWTAVTWPSAFHLYFSLFESPPVARPSP